MIIISGIFSVIFIIDNLFAGDSTENIRTFHSISVYSWTMYQQACSEADSPHAALAGRSVFLSTVTFVFYQCGFSGYRIHYTIL